MSKNAVSPCALSAGRGVWVPDRASLVRDDGGWSCAARHPGYDAPMTKILIVNPNTTASMTETIGAAARAVAAPGTEISAVTSPMGPVSIEGYYDEAFAVPGLGAARSAARFPVVGICEAALVTAGQIAKRIAVVTTLPRSIVPLEELVRRYGFAERARVTACNVAVLDLEK